MRSGFQGMKGHCSETGTRGVRDRKQPEVSQRCEGFMCFCPMAALIAGLVLLSATTTVANAGSKQLKKAPKITSKADYTARGSVSDATVKDADPGQRLLLVNENNRIVRSGKTDRFGSKIFYDVAPDRIFTVRTPTANGSQGSRRSGFSSPDRIPKQSWYDAKPDLKAGLNYVTMRDGTELAVTVRLPCGKTSLSQGPFRPTSSTPATRRPLPMMRCSAWSPACLTAACPEPLGDLLDTITGSLPGSPVPDPDLTRPARPRSAH